MNYLHVIKMGLCSEEVTVNRACALIDTHVMYCGAKSTDKKKMRRASANVKIYALKNILAPARILRLIILKISTGR